MAATNWNVCSARNERDSGYKTAKERGNGGQTGTEE